MQSADHTAENSAYRSGTQADYARPVKISSLRHLRRRTRLSALVNEAGGVAALGRLVGTPKSHVSALMSGARGVGDDLAAKLERQMQKPAGWMDLDGDLTEEALEIGLLYDAITDPSEKDRARAIFGAVLRNARPAPPSAQEPVPRPDACAPAPAPKREPLPGK